MGHGGGGRELRGRGPLGNPQGKGEDRAGRKGKGPRGGEQRGRGKSEKGWLGRGGAVGRAEEREEYRYPLSREVSPMMNSWHEQKEC